VAPLPKTLAPELRSARASDGDAVAVVAAATAAAAYAGHARPAIASTHASAIGAARLDTGGRAAISVSILINR
jgi:hypothetical protein